MEPDLLRFDDRHGFERKKTNFFAWTITILVLSGITIAAWLGSIYIIGQPERPESYRILQKLHKIDPPKRFALTAAPAGEFLNPKQLFARYQAMGPAELARKDAELTRNFIRNFQQVHGLVTYVVGRFYIIDARELNKDDVFTSGAVALARAGDQPELLMEHVFTTANEHDARLLKERLVMGMDINLERSHDLSAVIHAERLPDGQVQITAIPLALRELCGHPRDRDFQFGATDRTEPRRRLADLQKRDAPAPLKFATIAIDPASLQQRLRSQSSDFRRPRRLRRRRMRSFGWNRPCPSSANQLRCRPFGPGVARPVWPKLIRRERRRT